MHRFINLNLYATTLEESEKGKLNTVKEELKMVMTVDWMKREGKGTPSPKA